MNAYGGSYGMMGSGAWSWGLVMIAVPAVILVVILWAALAGLGAPSVAAHGVLLTPLDILDERYARGELSRDDYLRAREDLVPGRLRS